MKRVGNLYKQIYTYDNLCKAFYKARKGKQFRPAVKAFQNNFDAEIRKLGDQLMRRDCQVGDYRFFRIHDPKPRNICAAAFPERVLHHAIMNVCEPVLERYAIYDTYACRKGKGLHKAVARAQSFSRRFPWYLKIDIRKYFDSIDHSIALKLLARRIKDPDLLLLFDQILSTYRTQAGRGAPIGNLISQHLANFYLGAFDHHIKETRRVRGYLRYMDDMLIFGPNREFMKKELAASRDYIREALNLELKQPVQLNRCALGIPFLGFRIFPRLIRLSPRNRSRFVRKFRAYEQHWLDGEWSDDELIRHMEPLIDFTRTADAKAFRRQVIERHGVVSF